MGLPASITQILFLYSNDPNTRALNRFSFVPILILMLSCHACENNEGKCTEDLVCRVNAGFYVRDSLGERDTVLSNLTFYGASRPDSLLYDGSSGISRIEFPLPGSPGEYTSFVFRVDTLTDTINIWHTPILVMVSYECGFTANHNIYWINYQKNAIDTISIPEPLVDLTDEENLKIYIRPAAADTAVTEPIG